MAANNNAQRFRPAAPCVECEKPFGRYSCLQVRCAGCNRGRKTRLWRARKSSDPEWRKEQTAKNKAWLSENPERAALYNSRRREKAIPAGARYANPLVCQDCGTTEARVSGRQIVCEACAKIKRPLSARIREGIRQSLFHGKKASWSKLVDYTVDDLRRHLERQFTKGMSWDNFGDWHIDHIVPISSFTFTSAGDEQFKQCWSLTNLRPLWARENMSKAARRELLL